MGLKPSPDGHLHLMSGSRKVWGTDLPPIQLIPDAWQSIPVTIQFPDFPKDVAYGFNIFTTSPTNITTHYGMSVVKILPQELTLPDITLGTVPSPLINYVDWRVVLNWTKRPSPARGGPVISPVVRGKQTDLRGGSGLIEVSGCFRRMIHIGLVGQSIVLSRRQSTRNIVEAVDWSPGNATHYSNGGPRPGWTYGSQQRGTFAYVIDKRSAGSGVTRSDGNRASLTDPTNYSSTWAGTLLVKPGRANTTI